MDFNDSTTYENYLFLRRQLGEQENGDISAFSWQNAVEGSRREHIGKMLKRVAELHRGRDLSWGNYLQATPGQMPRTYRSGNAWKAAPLFIKASIIKPNDSIDPATRELFSVRMRKKDMPETEVVAW